LVVSPNRTHDRRFFYKYTSARIAKTILVNKTLRFSSPILFKDPFDVQRKLRFAFDGDELGAAIAQEVRHLIETGAQPETTINPKLRHILRYASTLNCEQRSEMLAGFNDIPWRDPYKLQPFQELQHRWEWTIPRSHILSLTEVNDNPVMWSTYAENYRGVVLQLECIDLYNSPLLLAQPVQYSDNVPALGDLQYWTKSITGQIPLDYDALFKQLEYTKMTKWAYEQEWRVISFEKNSDQLYSDYEMHSRTFAAVFLGKDMSREDRKDFLDLSSFDLSNMEVHEMSLDHSQRRIIFNRIG
jgi:hypothetical protein